MKYWNPENLMYIHTDEFKYLDGIDDIIEQSKNVIKILNQIKDVAYFNIQCGEVNNKVDFTKVQEKLIELNNIIDEL